MRKIAILLTFFLLSSTMSWAAEGPGDRKWPKRLWKASLAAVVAGSVMDMQSSMGKHEVNGLLANHSGVFASQGIGLKFAIAGAALGTQHFLMRKNPTSTAYKTGAAINFAVAGAFVGVSIHNYGTKAAQ